VIYAVGTIYSARYCAGGNAASAASLRRFKASKVVKYKQFQGLDAYKKKHSS
jgi:hypothetical protein